MWIGSTGVLLLAMGWMSAASASCPPAGYDADSLQALKARAFELPEAKTRATLAIGLVDCLDDPDPTLRDGIAYEALTAWMRKDQLAPDSLRALRDRLLSMLGDADPDGFRRPFAALVLSELARTDRIRPWLSDGERAQLVTAAADYLRGVRDYRGFDQHEGWRHGVAHGADFALQLALNSALDRPQLDALRSAIAAQVAPAGDHAYIQGEPLRLARPILFIAARGLHDEADWRAWFTAIAAPAPLPDWDAAFTTDAGLAKRHNTVAFLTALYTIAQEHDDAAARARLLPGLRAVLKEVP
ncbi:MAG TPA: DUF2785 domain-containing protein [Lysobacter sp.]